MSQIIPIRYVLSITNDGVDETFADDGKNLKNETVKVSYNDRCCIKYGGKTMYISLVGLAFHRRIYQPGMIDAEVLITGESLPSVGNMREMFLKKNVQLDVWVGSETTSRNLAKGYYIHEISPHYEKRAATKALYLKLKIYSIDNLMRIDKFSQAYLGRKLREYIVAKALEDYTLSVGGRNYTITLSGFGDGGDTLQHLSYDGIEFTQPYLVQYNETFYDFLARVCNRCGELLYFEDGKLHVGIDSGELIKAYNKKAPEVSDYSGLTYQYISDGVVSVSDYSHDSLKQEDSDPDKADAAEPQSSKSRFNIAAVKETGAHPEIKDSQAGELPVRIYNDEVAADEFFMPLYRDQFSDGEILEYLRSKAVSIGLKFLKALFNKNILDKVSYFAEFFATGLVNAAIAGDKDNDDGNAIIDVWAGDDQKMGAPFADNERRRWTTLRYYRDIREKEERQERQMVCVDMGSTFTALRIGDVVKFPDDRDNVYIVVEIDMQADQPWQRSYDGYRSMEATVWESGSQPGCRMKFYAVPAVMEGGIDNPVPDWLRQKKYKEYYDSESRKTDSTGKKLLAEEEICLNATNLLKNDLATGNGTVCPVFYPPLLPSGAFRQTEPQHAIVIDSGDPKHQGRVRVRYPWQRKVSVEMLETDDPEINKLLGRLNFLKQERDYIKAIPETDNTDAIKASSTRLQDEINRVGNNGKTVDDEITELKQKYDEENLDEKIKKLDKDIEAKEKQIKKEKDETNLATYRTDLADMKAKNEVYKKVRADYKRQLEKLTELQNENKALTDIKGKVNDGKKADALELVDKECERLDGAIEEKAVKPMALLEAGTPWIRMVTPMATKGGGVYFKPEKGDEVLVDFENGNIERPYVVGTLYSKNALAPDGSRIIQSPNGHFIKMDDPTDVSKLLASFWPGIEMLKDWQLFSGIKLEQDKSLLGGITMSDALGTYKIAMSSHERKVEITSAFGDVKIDALTGITVSAPNGNVKIEGKNIDIKAGNRLTLVSGENFKKDLAGSFKALGMAPDAFAETLVNRLDEGFGDLIDLSFMRSMLEIVLKPVNGTLRIKSNGFLLLEAGKGSAEIPETAYRERVLADKDLSFESKGSNGLAYIFATLSSADILSPAKQVATLFNDAAIKLAALYVNGYSIFNDANQAGMVTMAVDTFVQRSLTTKKYKDMGMAWDPQLANDLKAIYEPNVIAAHGSLYALRAFCDKTLSLFSHFSKLKSASVYGLLTSKFLEVLNKDPIKNFDWVKKLKTVHAGGNDLKNSDFVTVNNQVATANVVNLDPGSMHPDYDAAHVTQFKRRLVYAILGSGADPTGTTLPINGNDFLKSRNLMVSSINLNNQGQPIADENTVVSDDTNGANIWAEYCKSLKLTKINDQDPTYVKAFLNSMGEGILGNLDEKLLSLAPERKVWSADVNGKILMSDSPSTVSFDYGQDTARLKSDYNSDTNDVDDAAKGIRDLLIKMGT